MALEIRPQKMRLVQEKIYQPRGTVPIPGLNVVISSFFPCAFCSGDGIIEIGAQWIHGEVSNPVYELACKNGLVHQTKGFNSKSV